MFDLIKSYDESYKQTHHLTVETLDSNTIRIFHHIKKYEDFYNIVLSENVSATYYYILFNAVRSIFINANHSKAYNPLKCYLYSYTTNAI